MDNRKSCGKGDAMDLGNGWTTEKLRDEILEHVCIDNDYDKDEACLGIQQGEIDRAINAVFTATHEKLKHVERERDELSRDLEVVRKQLSGYKDQHRRDRDYIGRLQDELARTGAAFENMKAGYVRVEDEKYRLLKAQLEAVRRERDEVKLYLTQERANRESLESCVDRDVQKMKDLQAQLGAVRKERDAAVGILIPWWVISAILEPVPPCCRASMERPVPHE